MRPRRRKTEAVLAGAALILAVPLFAFIAIGIWFSDPGPVFYLADRAGLRGVPFRMYKFRTMRAAAAPGSRIAGIEDPRIFRLGRLLRRFRLDELPQLLNILRGEMAFVGPRPEDPWIVDRIYTAADRETLDVLPGLVSPGTLYYFTHAEPFLDSANAEASYIAGPLQEKLALDRAYMRSSSASADLRLVARAVACVLRFSRDPKQQRENHHRYQRQ